MPPSLQGLSLEVTFVEGPRFVKRVAANKPSQERKTWPRQYRK